MKSSVYTDFSSPQSLIKMVKYFHLALVLLYVAVSLKSKPVHIVNTKDEKSY